MEAINPHAEDMFPILQKVNPCMQCHGDVNKIGTPKEKGKPVAMPKSPSDYGEGKKRHGSLAPRVPPLSRPAGGRKALGGNRALTLSVFLRNSPWNLTVLGRFFWIGQHLFFYFISYSYSVCCRHFPFSVVEFF